MKHKIIGLLIALFFSEFVIAQTPYYKETNWKKDSVIGVVKHSVYLIGNAGGDKQNPSLGLSLLENHLKNELTNSTVLFLGDNNYPSGIPQQDSPERKAAEKSINLQINALKNFKGNTYFIPGNHDWDHWSKTGWEGIKREERFVENQLNKGNTFLPDNGCPGPVEIPLGDTTILVIIDTQWWLHQYQKPIGENGACAVGSEDEFMDKLTKIIQDNKDKQILVAAHHPLFSNGYHGGHFSLKDHIFPLTSFNNNTYIPLPVIGSIHPLYRKYIANIQDINHPKYQVLIKRLLLAFEGHNNLIYTSGHEHNLQYFNKNKQHFIVSGSGSKANYVAKKNDADFTYAKQGFSKIIYLESGEVWIEFWAVNDLQDTYGELVFRKKTKDADTLKSVKKEPAINYSDSTITVTAGSDYKAGKFRAFMLGKHYRDVWTAPVKVKVIDLSSEKGGLTPIQLGGGMQTKSLRLKNTEGKEFVFRSIQKDPKRLLDEELRETWIGDIMQDQISMAHPYGAFVIPKLAEAAEIFHKNSTLVYIPDDPLLGKYRDVYKNTLALFEERASKNLSGYDNFGNATNAISTPKLYKKLHKSHHNVVDEKEVLKNRLFDMWIGDWDRHEDQWRWAKFDCIEENHELCYHPKEGKNGKGSLYKPIPRDRDQVFVKLDGVIPWIARRKSIAPKLAHFDTKIKNIEGLNINGRRIDETLLSRLSKNEWIKIASNLQSNLTDSIIENAFTIWPDTIYKLNGEEIINKLKARRNDLVHYAKEYYSMLAEEVEVTGSDKKEIFVINRKPNGNTLVKVYKKDKNQNDEILLYKREFLFSETKEIRLYGFGGDDKFKISGEAKKGILIRIIGGEGDDKVVDQSKVNGLRKLTKIYDDIAGIQIKGGEETKDLSSTDIDINSYTRARFVPNLKAPVIKIGSNIDDGLFVGAGIKLRNQGWRKTPQANDHKIVLAFAPKTSAIVIEHESNFYQVLHKWDLNIQTKFLSPNSTTNYYNLGNETFASNDDPNYYVVRFEQRAVQTSLQKQLNEHHTFRIGPKYEYVEVKKTENRFISSPQTDLTPSAFESAHFMGLKLQYILNTTDNSKLPTKGIRWNTEGTWLQNLSSSTNNTKLQSDVSFFFTFFGKLKPTIATRFGGATIFNDYEFFQANTLGAQTKVMGQGNLRGFRRDRFSGRSTAYQNTELRLKLLNLKSYLLPGELGVYGFIDHGKVWTDNENSSLWHKSYGGGIWFSPLKMMVLTTSYEVSKEENIFGFNLNYLF